MKDLDVLGRIMRVVFPVWVRICVECNDNDGSCDLSTDWGTVEQKIRGLLGRRGEGGGILKAAVSLNGGTINPNEEGAEGGVTVAKGVSAVLPPPGHFGLATITNASHETMSKTLAILVIAIYLCQANTTTSETTLAVGATAGGEPRLRHPLHYIILSTTKQTSQHRRLAGGQKAKEDPSHQG